MTDQFDFRTFLQSCIGKPYNDILSDAISKATWADSLTDSRRGGPKARADGGSAYAAELKSFIFYLTYFTKPATGSYGLYEPVVQWLIESKQVKPEALDVLRKH
jgi:hypothetical protein